jgi:hypothetical protein
VRMLAAKHSISAVVAQVFVIFCSRWRCLRAIPRRPRWVPLTSSRQLRRLPGRSWDCACFTAAIFVVVFILLTYCVVRFRKRANDDGHEPPQVYGSNQVEVRGR